MPSASGAVLRERSHSANPWLVSLATKNEIKKRVLEGLAEYNSKQATEYSVKNVREVFNEVSKRHQGKWLQGAQKKNAFQTLQSLFDTARSWEITAKSPATVKDETKKHTRQSQSAKNDETPKNHDCKWEEERLRAADFSKPPREQNKIRNGDEEGVALVRADTLEHTSAGKIRSSKALAVILPDKLQVLAQRPPLAVQQLLKQEGALAPKEISFVFVDPISGRSNPKKGTMIQLGQTPVEVQSGTF